MSHVQHPLVDSTMMIRHQYLTQWDMTKNLAQAIYLVSVEFNNHPPKPIHIVYPEVQASRSVDFYTPLSRKNPEELKRINDEELWALARQHPNIIKMNSDLAALKTSCGHVAAENLEIAEETVKCQRDYEEMLKYFNSLKASYAENLAAYQMHHKTSEFYRAYLDKAIKEAVEACKQAEETMLTSPNLREYIEKKKRLKLLLNVSKILKAT
mmetsp:Transcript_19992/g.37107  ORF Transcript_19992/g.37107 Transcript_19992/m.37107 type:complete len:211 (-) Transcript_19992:625-1257(-)